MQTIDTSELQIPWKDIFKIVKKKSDFEKEVLMHELGSFPLFWLKKIKVTNDIKINKEN